MTDVYVAFSSKARKPSINYCSAVTA